MSFINKQENKNGCERIPQPFKETKSTFQLVYSAPPQEIILGDSQVFIQ